MFGNNNTTAVATGTVVAVRKAAVETFVTVDTGSGDLIRITMTKPRFDSLSISTGSKVVVGDHQNVIGIAS